MKELSLNILDIVENSQKAGSTFTEIRIEEKGERLNITIKDNGCGMSKEILESVIDPFYTTRTTRNVGLGIPLIKMQAEQTGGFFSISSKTKEETEEEYGTEILASFNKDHIDFTPLGDIISTITTVIQGHQDTDFYFCHQIEEGQVCLDTREIREVLEGVPLGTYEVIKWIEEFLQEQYSNL